MNNNDNERGDGGDDARMMIQSVTKVDSWYESVRSRI